LARTQATVPIESLMTETFEGYKTRLVRRDLNRNAWKPEQTIVTDAEASGFGPLLSSFKRTERGRNAEDGDEEGSDRRWTACDDMDTRQEVRAPYAIDSRLRRFWLIRLLVPLIRVVNKRTALHGVGPV